MAVEIRASLAAELEYAEKTLGYWTEMVERMKDEIREAAGEDAEITVNGRLTWTYERTATFKAKTFIKEQDSELVDQFMGYVSSRELDVAKLKIQRPDLYQKYQSRTLRRVA